jgi:hypothetical protein
MRGSVALLALLLVMITSEELAQSGSPQPTPKQSWFGHMFHRHSPAPPEYGDPRLRGLALNFEVSPQPVKLDEVRQLAVKVTLTNLSKHAITLQFPTEQRIEVNLGDSSGRVLTRWSDNHAFQEKPATILINVGEHIEYDESIATRDLVPNTVFIAEVYFPRYPDLRIRKKFLTAP